MITLICALAIAAPDKPLPPVIDFNYETVYGKLTQTGKVVQLEGEVWDAIGRIREDGSLYLLWTEKSTGRPAPSVYTIKNGMVVGVWGWGNETVIEDDGSLSGNVRPDRLDKVHPPPAEEP